MWCKTMSASRIERRIGILCVAIYNLLTLLQPGGQRELVTTTGDYEDKKFNHKYIKVHSNRNYDNFDTEIGKRKTPLEYTMLYT